MDPVDKFSRSYIEAHVTVLGIDLTYPASACCDFCMARLVEYEILGLDEVAYRR